MCKSEKPALNIKNPLKDLKSLLYYFPAILLLFVNFYSFDYSNSASHLTTGEVVLCSDSNVTSYTAGRVDLGEANTIEGYRIENVTVENRTKNPESGSFKYLAARYCFQLQAKVHNHQNHTGHAICDVIDIDRPVTFHKLII